MTTEEFLYPTHCLLNVYIGGMCIWDTVMAELGIGISKIDFWSQCYKTFFHAQLN